MIPGRRILPNSLVGQDMWFSPTRPGFESRLGNFDFLFFVENKKLKLQLDARKSCLGVRVWSSLVMTPASHAGNPEFESRHAYAFWYFLLSASLFLFSLLPFGAAFDTLPEWLRGSPAK